MQFRLPPLPIHATPRRGPDEMKALLLVLAASRSGMAFMAGTRASPAQHRAPEPLMATLEPGAKVLVMGKGPVMLLAAKLAAVQGFQTSCLLGTEPDMAERLIGDASLPLTLLPVQGGAADPAAVEAAVNSAEGLIIAFDGEEVLSDAALNIFMPKDGTNFKHVALLSRHLNGAGMGFFPKAAKVRGPRYTLPATRYTPHAPRPTPYATRYTLHIPRYTIHATHPTLHATRYTLHIPHYTLHATRYTPHATRYTPHTPRYTLHDTRHTPHATRHTPHAKRCTRHATRYTLPQKRYPRPQGPSVPGLQPTVLQAAPPPPRAAGRRQRRDLGGSRCGGRGLQSDGDDRQGARRGGAAPSAVYVAVVVAVVAVAVAVVVAVAAAAVVAEVLVTGEQKRESDHLPTQLRKPPTAYRSTVVCERDRLTH